MVKLEIEALKNELNAMIKEDADYMQIYETSVKLDKLIVRYYTEEKRRRH